MVIDRTVVVGRSIFRRDAVAKVRGQAPFAGDVSRPRMVYGKIIRSPHAHALIRRIDLSRALAHPGVIGALTAADIPGKNVVGPRQVKDQPVLAEDRVRFAGEAVAVVIAESPESAREAAELVEVSYQSLEVLAEPERALDAGAPFVHSQGNLCHEMRISRGSFLTALRQAALVVSNTFFTQMVDHSYIEPDAVVAEPAGDGVVVWVTSKSPHVDQGEVARVLALPKEKVRVVVATVGGSFGGKPDLPMVCLAGLIALRTGRPAKIVLDREECFLAKTKRHPYRMEYTHAVAGDGTILGVKVEILADAGAYASFTPTVVSKGLVHAAGPYRVPNVEMRARAVYTNNPVTGAMRGYGVPQVVFAVERQMDIIARKLGMDPFELRIKNALRPGDVTVTGQMVNEARLLEALLEARKKVEEIDLPSDEAPHIKRAWGIAAFYYGCGRTGLADSAQVLLRLEPDGYVQLFVGSPDTGQGSDTALGQIAAEELGLPFTMVRVISADTLLTLDSGTSTASRVTYVVGNAVKRAASELKQRLLVAASQERGYFLDSLPADPGYLAHLVRFCREHGWDTEVIGYFETATSPLDECGQGKPFGAYTFGVQVTQVKANTFTGKVDVERAFCCYDVGTVVNPKILEGQIEGGVAMALGYALTEEVRLNGGVPRDRNFDTYLIPTAADMPRVTVMTVDSFEQSGPFGAKGVGEPAALPGAASIVNAVSSAVGCEFFDLPVTPEKVVAAIQGVDRGIPAKMGSRTGGVKVEIRLLGGLSSRQGLNHFFLEFEGTPTLHQVVSRVLGCLTEVGKAAEEEHLVVALDGKVLPPQAWSTTMVGDGQVCAFFPPLQGGSVRG